MLASHNQHKLEELKRILLPLVSGIELIAYDGPEPKETGLSFSENALIKARAAAAHTGLPALADDSGISVTAMNGSPGIFSARWGGEHASDSTNVELLLWQMRDIDEAHRSAAFVCAAALVFAGNDKHHPREEVVKLGLWPGTLLTSPQGNAGFGYDPVFRPEGEVRSAAQMSAAEKDSQSHRSRAFAALAPEMNELLGS